MSKKLYVISGPSGIGISDILAKVFAGRDDVCAVTPVTARKMKTGEVDGVGFFFYDLEGWNALKESGDLLESTEFAGNDYGTSRRLVEEKLREGKNVMLNLSPDRARQISENMPEAITVWLDPSPAVLEERIQHISRSALEASVRLSEAKKECDASFFFQHRINIDDPYEAVSSLNHLIADD